MFDIETLKRFVPFCELDGEYLQEAMDSVREVHFNKGDMLFKRGRVLGERYYLLSGRVDLIDASYTSETLEANRDEAKNPLNPESPTRCSCIAKAPATVFVIETETLDRIVSWSESAASAHEQQDIAAANYVTGEIEVSSLADETASDWMSALLQSPLFSRVPLPQVQELFLRFENVKVAKGDVVIKEGEPGDYFYVLSSGSAHVTNHSSSVDVRLGPGSYFGEEALLGNTPRNATITMLSGGALKRLTAENFAALLKAPILKYVEASELEELDRPYKIIDVKMPIEFRISHLPDSINIPLARLRSGMSELAKTCVYAVPDDAGSRADIAAHLLCQAGFDALILKIAQPPVEEGGE